MQMQDENEEKFLQKIRFSVFTREEVYCPHHFELSFEDAQISEGVAKVSIMRKLKTVSFWSS